MLSSLLSAYMSGDLEALKWAIASVMLALPIVLLALCVHETAHGFVASKLGDPTASSMGRLTLNPAKHLDPIGFICMLCFGFGWAKPVPINTRYFKKPRRDMAICAAAGPISNVLLAFVFAALLKIFYIATDSVIIDSQMTYNLLMFGSILLRLGIQLNITLAVFNLLPIPPLDGSKILYLFLPQRILFKVIQYERYIYFGLLFLLLVGVLDIPLSFISGLLMGLISLIFGI